MPILDIPLWELKDYMGASPVPEDIDIFWDEALEEMKAVDANASMTKAEFSCGFADCYDMYFTGVDNARIYTKLIVPKSRQGKCPAVIKFHGYSASSGDWYNLLPYAAEGYVVAAMDCRGQGGKSRDTGDRGMNTLWGHIIRGLDDGPKRLLYRAVFLDTAQLAHLIMDMDEVDRTRVGCAGGSQGGALTIACAALVPEIKLIAPQYPFLSDFRSVWNMDLQTKAYEELTDYFRRFDPMHEREVEIFHTLGYIDIQNLCHRIKAEVLFFTGLVDEVCPPSSQFAAFNKIRSRKQLKIFPDFGHEQLHGAEDITFKFLRNL